ncbi:MAG: hypothetical protein QOH91_153 [Mycobacterium sp.]|nr:hypothetical protein [Mycobacterium sp.]
MDNAEFLRAVISIAVARLRVAPSLVCASSTGATNAA